MSKVRQDNCIRTCTRKRSSNLRRWLAAFFAVVIAASQCILLWPAFAEDSYAETAGEDFSVRVQYFGERGDLIREKARFTRDELESMGTQTWYYSNVTRVGTVMSMAARGPQVLAIIQEAGIDPGSVSMITFRTLDGYTRNFTVDQHLSGGRYFYPNLSALYERSEDGTTLIPLEGSLEGGYEVPSILALEFGATKAPGADAMTLTMGTDQTYRFCMGQTPLVEGQQTRPGIDGGDVSSMDSVHSIYGVDVTLIGSPVSGIGIDPVDTDMKVGSVTTLTIRVSGDELFAEDYSKALGKLTWKSSDPSIARVDKNGNVTILKKGTVTITVTAENGMTASIKINGTGKAKKKDQKAEATKKKEPAAAAATSSTTANRPTETGTREEAPKQKIHMREISLGGKVQEEPPEDVEERVMEEDAQALEKQRNYAPGTVAGASLTAIAACGAGGVIRYRRYRQILKGWKR